MRIRESKGSWLSACSGLIVQMVLSCQASTPKSKHIATLENLKLSGSQGAGEVVRPIDPTLRSDP